MDLAAFGTENGLQRDVVRSSTSTGGPVSKPKSAVPRYVSLAQAGDVAELSTRTLRRAIADGRLRAHRLGRLIRIDLAELRRWIEADGAAAPTAALPISHHP